jgi:hypothetical protein
MLTFFGEIGADVRVVALRRNILSAGAARKALGF